MMCEGLLFVACEDRREIFVRAVYELKGKEPETEVGIYKKESCLLKIESYMIYTCLMSAFFGAPLPSLQSS